MLVMHATRLCYMPAGQRSSAMPARQLRQRRPTLLLRCDSIATSTAQAASRTPSMLQQPQSLCLQPLLQRSCAMRLEPQQALAQLCCVTLPASARGELCPSAATGHL
jgi:hypothetical protein